MGAERTGSDGRAKSGGSEDFAAHKLEQVRDTLGQSSSSSLDEDRMDRGFHSGYCGFARIDLSIFQNTRFQPAPDQTDQAWITDPMRDEPEHPIMI